MEFLEKFSTVNNFPCVYIDELAAVVVSDLHIGIEISQTMSGVLMPRIQSEKVLEELEDIKESTDAEKLIIDGDLKHSFSGRNKKENEEVENFLQKLSMVYEKTVVVKGNHDNALEHRTEHFKNIELKEKHFEKGFLFVHGHKNFEIPVGTDYIILGHEHPALELKDDVGVVEKISCILYGSIQNYKVVVLPAYSELASGTGVNGMPKHRLLTPFLKKHGVEKLKAIGVEREAGVYPFPALNKIV